MAIIYSDVMQQINDKKRLTNTTYGREYINEDYALLTTVFLGEPGQIALINKVHKYDVPHMIDGLRNILDTHGTPTITLDIGLYNLIEEDSPLRDFYIRSDAGAPINIIIAITAAANAAITTVVPHGLVTGQTVIIENVSGMVEINGLASRITVVDPTHFTLDWVDSTAFTPYTSGGDSIRTVGENVFAAASASLGRVHGEVDYRFGEQEGDTVHSTMWELAGLTKDPSVTYLAVGVRVVTAAATPIDPSGRLGIAISYTNIFRG